MEAVAPRLPGCVCWVEVARINKQVDGPAAESKSPPLSESYLTRDLFGNSKTFRGWLFPFRYAISRRRLAWPASATRRGLGSRGDACGVLFWFSAGSHISGSPNLWLPPKKMRQFAWSETGGPVSGPGFFLALQAGTRSWKSSPKPKREERPCASRGLYWIQRLASSLFFEYSFLGSR